MASSINASTSAGLVNTADTSGILNLQTAGTTAVTIDASQNVGIGTTSPANFLDISKTQDAETSIGLSNTSTGANAQVRTKYTTNSGLFTVGTTGTAHPYGGDAYVYQVANKGIRFATNDTQRMLIDSSGNVLIGTTSYANPPSQGIGNFGNITNSQIGIGHANGTGSGQYYVVFGYNGGAIGGVTQNGTTAVAYNTSSDYRLKDNIAPMTGALDKVTQLKPVTYKWKVDGSNGQGFIAHELAEIVPDCVTGEKDAVETYTDEEGNEQTRIKPQGIDTSFLVATLTAAIQEQQTIINDLKARIETLEGVK